MRGLLASVACWLALAGSALAQLENTPDIPARPQPPPINVNACPIPNAVGYMGFGAADEHDVNYTLACSDAGRIVLSNTSSPTTVTIPPNSAVPFAINTPISFEQDGTGAMTVAPGSGVNLYQSGTTFSTSVTLGQKNLVTIVQTSPNNWLMTGLSGGGMILIQSVVTSGSQGSVTFSSIPSGYSHLQIRVLGRGNNASTTTNLRLQFNGDTGSNYDWQYVTGFTNAASASGLNAQTQIAVGDIAAASAPSGDIGSIVVEVNGYATAFFKSVVCNGGAVWGTSNAQEIIPIWGNWRNTAAITSIKLFPAAGTIANGSIFSLYAVP